MLNLLKSLCELSGVSGNETAVRDFILNEIKGYAEVSVDNKGNIIAFKKGKKTGRTVMADAHMDEVGIIVTSVTEDGFLTFSTVGGIKASALMCRKVNINGTIGVIGSKPIHLCKGDEAKNLPETDELYIDIGAGNKAEALSAVSLGSVGTFVTDFTATDGGFFAKAIDDRVGVAVLINLLKQQAEYDFYAVFSCGEEVGSGAAACAAFGIAAETAVVLECTTAADIPGVSPEKSVCKVYSGPAVSFMDGGAVYSKSLYNAAINSGIKCQPKAATTGGNNAARISTALNGIECVAISLPCRYIHSACSFASVEDIENMELIAKYIINFAAGENK